MQVWGCGNYREMISLADVAKFLGTPHQKIGDGADFAALFLNPETRKQALEYLENDLRVTWDVAERMGVL
jgi:hypothetical protein